MSRKALLAVIAVIAVTAIGASIVQQQPGSTATETVSATSPAAGEEVPAAEAVAIESAIDAAHPETTAEALPAEAAPGTLDTAKALAPRTMGDANAPVKIEEFASLSCSHCASFYKDTFPQLKAEYIDTGKVHFTYTDFPLNAPALDAAMVARCLPEAHYFNFIKMLFENQNQWAYNEKYREILQHNGAMLGMSTEYFNACLANEDLRKGLIDTMTAKSERHQIRSTPGFVFNGTEIIAGAAPYADFKTKIEALLATTATAE
ncbi:MAG: DsbA family protein [Alphaproteobacteria bacterium]|nr:DsbA family protein [Alphaproteobacteria bacterium]